jgi:hypothetical protein
MSRRSKIKYPALDPLYNTKLRREYLDIDYLHKLSDEEKEFLNKFMEEWMGGSFKKNENGNYTHENLHRKKKERKECYTRNNARNRCLFGIKKSSGLLTYANNTQLTNRIENSQQPSTNETENQMIEYLDSKSENFENEVGTTENERDNASDLDDKASN